MITLLVPAAGSAGQGDGRDSSIRFVTFTESPDEAVEQRCHLPLCDDVGLKSSLECDIISTGFDVGVTQCINKQVIITNIVLSIQFR